MDLSTSYLGLSLAHPLMPGASPLVDDLDEVKQLEDTGAAAIVMHSLFEEQIDRDEHGTAHHMAAHEESSAEAVSYFPRSDEFRLGPDAYLEQIRRIGDAVDIPVIGSLNGSTAEGWLEYASLIEQAGADALELNMYYMPTDPIESSVSVERRVVDAARIVKAELAIPVAVKLSPFYSALAHLAAELEGVGVDGLVLFNRFYQPEIDIESLEVFPHLRLSDPAELNLRLRWLAILSGRTSCSLAMTGGVHTVKDVIRGVMTGAHAVQIVSALLLNGSRHIGKLLSQLRQWMEEHEYESIDQMRGSMSLERCPDPSAFERANYMRVLQSWE